ncbi:hypothetical protein FHS00_000308 [Limimaricola variabilis]|uniref:DUF2946 domain-containing protein n=1 Tax=Limimaricola variabilis TaxID=1492771 RepID=A0ABR6HJL4_9RHOB|nr:hypothetical protein [Limimaricola variabilis]MBB3710755.1 hypothetical protein [Limimaricola variabilis]
MTRRIRLLAALPALIGMMLLLLASWGGEGGATDLAPVVAHHAETHAPTHTPKGHHDTTVDAACALMCLAQRSVAAGPEGFRSLARIDGGPALPASLPMRGRVPMPPWHPPEIV